MIGLSTFFNPTLNLVTTGAIETVGFVQRLGARRALYRRARAHADALGRPLVVVGAPSQGWVKDGLAQYRCGDLPCVDLGGCAHCRAPGRDVTKVGGIPARTDSAVVLCQYVLEYTDDPKAGYAEMVRVAGVERNVFVNRVQDWATVTRLYTGQKHLITAPPRLADDRWFHKVRKPFTAAQRKRRIG